ncbi:MAG: FAD:protein FMN transferase [Acidimicrobiales bacterium]
MGAIVHVEAVMGTAVSFHIFSDDGPVAAVQARIEAACHRLHELDAMFSIWDAASPMSRYRSGALALAVAPPEIGEVLSLCEEAKALTMGWFDPWAMPGGVDPTGLVKGWAVEQALSLVQSDGVVAAMVNGGGDIALFGTPPSDCSSGADCSPWRADALACVVEAANAVATSGAYERGAHLLDPRDGSRPTAVASATVTGPRLALADALATALAVGGDEVLGQIRSLDGYEAYLIRADGSEDATAGMVFAS